MASVMFHQCVRNFQQFHSNHCEMSIPRLSRDISDTCYVRWLLVAFSAPTVWNRTIKCGSRGVHATLQISGGVSVVTRTELGGAFPRATRAAPVCSPLTARQARATNLKASTPPGFFDAEACLDPFFYRSERTPISSRDLN